jgi:hypothetical protein
MGYGEYKTKVKLDYIQDFEMMFERMKSGPRKQPIIQSIMDCPKEFLSSNSRVILQDDHWRPLKLTLQKVFKVLFSANSDEELTGKLPS